MNQNQPGSPYSEARAMRNPELQFIKPVVGNAPQKEGSKCPFAFLFEGPRGLPFLGSYISFFKNPLAFFQGLKKHGSVARFHIGSADCYQLNEPADIRNFLVRDYQLVEKAGIMVQARRVLGDALFTTEGAAHKRQRRLTQPAFSSTRIKEYGRVVAPYVRAIVGKWGNNQTIDMTAEMNRLSLGIAGRTLFGADLYKDGGKLNEAVSDILEFFNPSLMMVFGLWAKLPTRRARRFNAAKALLENVVRQMIKNEMIKTEPSSSLLSILIHSMRQEGPLDEAKIKEIRDHAMTFLLAGHETVGTALNWVWHLLSINPDAEARLHEELEETLGGVLPDVEDAGNLPYTEMVIKEAMRMFPPVWAMKRRVKEDYRVGNRVIPAGSIVGISQYALHRDPVFFPEPEKFNPMRWTPEEEEKRPDYSYFPFGGGARSCIGAEWAMLEMKLLVAAMAQMMALRPVSKDPVELKPLITLRPKENIRMIVHRRKITAERPAVLPHYSVSNL